MLDAAVGLPRAFAADAGDELRRRAKGLTKKLKAVSELETRVAAGLEPNAQQAEKLARRGELEKELAAAMDYYDKLKPSCVDAGVSYEDRVARRKEEIESLQDATKILSGEDLA